MSQGLPTLDALEVAGQRVLLRLDLNVPLRDGEITDTTRIDAALPTIRQLREAGARVVICSHLGRPRSKRIPALSLEPVAAKLAELLDDEVVFAHDVVGDDVEFLSRDIPPGGVLVLENLRFDPGEKANDDDFAGKLARLGDVYVNDAFGTMHRAHASVVGVVSRFDHVAIGPLVDREITALSKLLEGPARPFIGVLGGAKVSDKIEVIESLLHRVDALVVGGAMAYTFLAAQDTPVGDSLVERERIRLAGRLLERCAARGVQVFLPTDHVVAESPESEEVQTVRAIEPGWKGFDIGPETVRRFSEIISRSSTVFWNGPMGMFEDPRFAEGTRGVARAVAEAEAYTVVGGGDSAAALHQCGYADQVSHLSTGGGASLEFIQGKELPGIRALRRRT
ncbi:MAG: phosphoglycerate kinase [Alphaproteobacteria bacterium]|nr:phosphoglycerate kinase [Alphaproteobacteria bacterium]